MNAIRIGYIQSFPSDLIWFLSLPLLAVALAMVAGTWLPFAALASINLWNTISHHFSTWFRVFSLPEDWKRWKGRLIVGPVLITAASVTKLIWAPLTAVLVSTAWDHQHSLMQQHGFARIYDFKARAGSQSTGKFDLWLNIVLYVNLLITAPLWGELWIYESFR